MNTLIEVISVGVIATLVADLWAIARQSLLGIAPPDYRMVGRWIAHMRYGRFQHAAIANSCPMLGEGALGWIAHYLIGIAFAALLVFIAGQGWLQSPTLVPALSVGIITVLAPFCLMQPGMGAGFAASKTPRPNAARLQSLLTHAVFGLGLYAGGRCVALVNTFFL